MDLKSSNISPAENILGISHINIIVEDIEKATEFYARTLGFQQAHNDDGPMDYSDVEMDTFARNAGFLDQRVIVDVRFLQHPTAKIYLELMRYQEPHGSQDIKVMKTNDLGGPRHIALEVADATAMFHFLKAQSDVKLINESPNYGPPEELTPFPIRFFYWLDPWGVQWEMEEGRPIGDARGIIG